MKKLLIILLLLFAVSSQAQIDTASWSLQKDRLGHYSLLTNRVTFAGVGAGYIRTPLILSLSQIDTSKFQLIKDVLGHYSVAINKASLYGIDSGKIRIGITYDVSAIRLNEANTWTGIQYFDTAYAKRFNFGKDTTGYIGTNGKLYLGSGNNTRPSYSFSSELNSGVYLDASNGVTISKAGTKVSYFNSTYQTTIKLGIGDGSMTGTYGWLIADANNVLALKNGTDAGNTFRIYADDSAGTSADKYLRLSTSNDSTLISVVGNRVGNLGGNLYINSQKNKDIFLNGVPSVPLTKSNLVYVSDSVIYIASKYSTTHDCVIKFNKTNFNLLPSFAKVYLIANTAPNISPSFFKDAVATTIMDVDGQYATDNIGPYKISGRTDWIGGNHGVEGTATTLTAGYTSPSTELSVTDATLFVRNGSYARVGGYYAKYTATDTVNNKLTGVTFPNQIVTTIANGAAIYMYHPTAINEQYEIYADGKVVSDSTIIEADDIGVIVRNKLYDSNTLNMWTGVADAAIYDNVFYRISENNIEVMLETQFIKDLALVYYYGMQYVPTTAVTDSVYMAHADTTTLRPRGYYPSSGDHEDYWCEKTILSNNAKSINVAMWYDTTSSYYGNRASYLNANVDLFMYSNSSGKVYRNQISKSGTAFTEGDKQWWRGVYTFFTNPTLDTATYAYKMKFRGKDYLAIDFHKIGTETISIPEYHSTTMVKYQDDATLTTDLEVKPRGINSVSTAYGNGYYKLEK